MTVFLQNRDPRKIIVFTQKKIYYTLLYYFKFYGGVGGCVAGCVGGCVEGSLAQYVIQLCSTNVKKN